MQAYQRHFPLYAVICQCGLQTRDTSVEKAVEIWNKRQPIDDIVAELDKISELARPVGWSRKIEIVETKAAIDIVKRGGVSIDARADQGSSQDDA